VVGVQTEVKSLKVEGSDDQRCCHWNFRRLSSSEALFRVLANMVSSSTSALCSLMRRQKVSKRLPNAAKYTFKSERVLKATLTVTHQQSFSGAVLCKSD